MFEFIKNLKNTTPIVNPNPMRQQANLDALQAVADFQNLVKTDVNNAGFSPQSVDLINKIGIDNVVNGIGKGLNNGVPEIRDWINQYNSGVGRNNPLGIEQPAVLQGGVAEKSEPKLNLMNALRDMSAGFKENISQPISVSNFEKRVNPQEFKAGINPEDYRTQLTAEEQKNFDIWANDMRKKGAISADDKFQDYDMQGYWKNEVLNNTDLANGSAQNHFTDKYKMPNHATFSNESMYATGENAKYAGKWDGDKFIAPRNENIMTKIGEGMGTVARIVDNPLVKALLVGGAVSATGGSPADALGYGVKTGAIAQQAQMRNELYRQKLKSLGYSDADLEKIRGYVGNSEYQTLADGLYKEKMAEYRNLMAQNAQNKLLADMDYRAQDLAIKKQNADSQKRRADAYVKLAEKGGRSGSVDGGKGSGKNNPMYGKHLAEYNQLLASGDQNKINYAQNKFIELYGEDPNKSLKSENDILKLLEALGDE